MAPDPRTVTSLANASVNERMLDLTIRHSLFVEGLKAQEAERVLAFLRKTVYPDLINTVRTGLGSATKREVSKALSTAIDNSVKQGISAVLKDQKVALAKVAISEAKMATNALTKAVGKLPISFNQPSSRILKQLVDNPIHGVPLSKWWGGLAAKTADSVKQQLEIGIASGESIQQMVQRLRGTRAGGFRDGILSTTSHNAETVVRTSVTHVSNGAREATWRDNTDVISKVQFIATLDARTSEDCADLDGQVFDIGDGPRPPIHPSCRSTTVPVLKSAEELGFVGIEVPEEMRASFDGAVPSKLTYPGWLKQQSNATQDLAIGPARAKLFRDGKISISQLRSSTGKKRTLAELYALVGEQVDPPLPPIKPLPSVQPPKPKPDVPKPVADTSVRSVLPDSTVTTQEFFERLVNLEDGDPDGFSFDTIKNELAKVRPPGYESAKVNIRLDVNQGEKALATQKQAKAFLKDFIPKSVVDENGWNARVKVGASQRAAAKYNPFDGQHQILASVTDPTQVFVHEMSHTLEFSSQRIVNARAKWFAERTKGLKPEPLNKIYNSKWYGADEVAIKDGFLNAYMGKVYEGAERGSEIISMGMEVLYNDAGNLLYQDPDYFKFMLRIFLGDIP